MAGVLGLLIGILFIVGLGIAIGRRAGAILGSRRPFHLPKPVVVGAIVAVGLGGFLYSGLLFSGPGDFNCVGQSDLLRAIARPDGAMQFSGSEGPNGNSTPYTMPFRMTGLWQIAWQSQQGELHISLYDASVNPPNHNYWIPFHDNSAGHLEEVFSSVDLDPHAGSMNESRNGLFCLTIEAGFHYDPNVDVNKLTATWVVTVAELS